MSHVGMESWMLALLFLGLAVVQIVPELAIKRFAEEIYGENRDIEAKVTECMVSAYRGFSVIKNFNLTEWYMQRLEKLHEEYAVLGTKSIGIGTVETSAQQLITYLLQYGVYVGAGLLVLWGKIPLSVAIAAISLSLSRAVFLRRSRRYLVPFQSLLLSRQLRNVWMNGRWSHKNNAE